ncbi:CHAT domain-containing protein [Streptomyces sp. NPDC057027]|uniref:CHAT domain-containing protein n=1 Tax=Streptomyces sp. NPDC057027 TaxID=3346004 RepID=UPI00363D145D
MSDGMIAALDSRLSRYEESRDRTLLEEPEAHAESTAVLQTALASLDDGRLDVEGLSTLCWFHAYRFDPERGVDVPDIDAAIAMLLASVLVEALTDTPHPTPPVPPDLVSQEPEQALAACESFAFQAPRLARSPARLASARAVLEIAARLTSTPRLRRKVLSTLAHVEYDSHQESGDVAGLERAVHLARQAADPELLGPSDPGPTARMCNSLGTALYFLYEATYEVDLLEESVFQHARFMEIGPGDEPVDNGQLAHFMDNLGAALFTLAETRRDPETLHDALEAFKEAARIHDAGPARWAVLDKVWRALALVPTLCRSARELDEAIAEARALLDRGGEADPRHAAHLIVLSKLLHDRWCLSGTGAPARAVLDEFVEATRRAWEAYPEDAPERWRATTNLYMALTTRSMVTGSREDEREAKSLASGQIMSREAVVPEESVPFDSSPESPSAPSAPSAIIGELRALNALAFLYSTHSNPLYLETAIRRGNEALSTVAPGDPGYAYLHAMLAELHEDRIQLTGRSEELDHDVARLRSVLSHLAEDSPDWADVASTLGQLLRVRYEQRGAKADIYEAVHLATASLGILGEGPARARSLNRLGLALRLRYDHNRDLTDLRASIAALSEAVELLSDDPDMKASVLDNLGTAQGELFSRLGDVGDLEKSIAQLRECVALTENGQVHAATRWDNLASALLSRYDRNREPGDLDEALAHARRAVEETPPDHVERGRRVSRIAALLRARFVTRYEIGDLTAAIAYARGAVRAIPLEHAHRAEFLGALGGQLKLLFRVARATAELDEAPLAFDEAAAAFDEALAAFDEGRKHTSSLIHLRARCAREWASLRALRDDDHGVQAAVDGAELALELLSEIDWHGMTVTDRLRLVEEWRGFASEAASWALSSGDPDRAVDFLEQGRGLLWAQLTEHETDIERLREVDDHLADRFLSVRAQARQLTDGKPARASVQGALESGRADFLARVNDEHRALVREIRCLDGFDAFLGPPSLHSLATAIDGGTVVVLNVGPTRCDAVLVTASGKECLPLAVTVEEVSEQAARFTDAWRTAGEAQAVLSAAGPSAPRAATVAFHSAVDEMADVLAWGWDNVTGPVLEALGHRTAPGEGESWPRVWWCPTGPLTAFPLIATGHHDGSMRSVIDRVVSSEAPTLRILAEAGSSAPARGEPRLLVASVPTPYDRTDVLHGVTDEVASVSAFSPVPVTRLDGPDVTRAALLQGLPGHTWFHFAGHGAAAVTDPADTALSAFDAPVTLADLTGLRRVGGVLAYLSTCHGAAPGTDHLDESAHLAAAVHVAGFRHVIAVRQELDDRVGAELAAAFYRALGDEPDPGLALHRALRALRDRLGSDAGSALGSTAYPPVNPWEWAGFVHLGPAAEAPA